MRYFSDYSLLAPLGLSPPIVTELIQYLDWQYSMKPKTVELILTRDKRVQEGAKLVEVAVKDRYPKAEVVSLTLDYEDIVNENVAFDFMRIAASEIARLEKPVYLLISGGRKNVSVEVALLGQVLAVSGIYHVVVPDVRVVNIELERLRPKIEELASSGDPLSYYRENEELQNLMYPPMTYGVMRIPMLPLPYSIIRRVARILSEGGSRSELEDLGEDYIAALRFSGLIQVSGGRIIPTDLGRAIGEAMREAVE
ncbi:MAG: CRISPR-associated ring nuclease [Candidatus Korarchaeota archaeon]|nr:CRISPR-associated ring nuclease [Candidatus Korarchaeota archaeon]